MGQTKRAATTNQRLVGLIIAASRMAFDDDKQAFYNWSKAKSNLEIKKPKVANPFLIKIHRDFNNEATELFSQLNAVYRAACFLRTRMEVNSEKDRNDKVNLLEEKYLECVENAKEMLAKIERMEEKGKNPNVSQVTKNFLKKIVDGSVPVQAALSDATKETSNESETSSSYANMQVLAKKKPPQVVAPQHKTEEAAPQTSSSYANMQVLAEKKPPQFVAPQDKKKDAAPLIPTKQNDAGLASLKANPKIMALIQQIEDKMGELAKDMRTDQLASDKYAILDSIVRRIAFAKSPADYLKAVKEYTDMDSDELKTLDTARKFGYRLFCMKADTGDLVRNLTKEVNEAVKESVVKYQP